MVLSRLITLITLASVTFSSCRQDEVYKPEKSRLQMLTESGWLLVEAYSNTNKDNVPKTIDLYAAMEDCDKDNITYFNTDHKVTIHGEGIKCYDSEPEIVTPREWVLISNSELEFTEILSERTYTAAIFELSEEFLHYRVSGTKDDSTHFEDTYKYKKVN